MHKRVPIEAQTTTAYVEPTEGEGLVTSTDTSAPDGVLVTIAEPDEQNDCASFHDETR